MSGGLGGGEPLIFSLTLSSEPPWERKLKVPGVSVTEAVLPWLKTASLDVCMQESRHTMLIVRLRCLS